MVCGREDVPKERYEVAALEANTTKFYKSVGLMDEECCHYGLNECCIIYHKKATATAQ